MKQSEKIPLPIDPFIPKILDAVRNYSTVLVKASPGSGKTTRLPWALADSLKQKVVVLEPRRLAAKLAAQRISEEEGLTLGQEVGYHFRFEKMISGSTPLIFYTEGTFLKKFLTSQELEDVDIVVLDEFHERHLETDLALALLRNLQKKRGLKIILMSATLDLRLLESFEDVTSIEITAPLFPVEVTYLPNQPSILNQMLEQKVKKALDMSPSGDVLVFLPGMREMLSVEKILQGNLDVYLLHAELSKEEQNKALRPSPHRKVILATNIAESSVTIPGVSVVIDSGIQREAHYSPWNGLKFIQDTPVTQSSAIQRAGRAGRTGPGVCHRLYSQQDYNERPQHTVAEIKKADLTDVALLVAGTGITPHWFEAPPVEKWIKANELLEKIGALGNHEITPTGKRMLEYPLDSRLSRVLLAGEQLQRKEKEKLLNYVCEEVEEDRSGVLRRRLNFYLQTEGKESFPWERCLLSGFPDQLARYREKHRDFVHYSGKTIKAHFSLSQLQDGYYLILDITQKQEAIKILEIEEEWLWEMEPFPFSEEDEIQISDKITIRRKTKIGSIVVEENQLKQHWGELPLETKKRILDLSKAKMRQEIEGWQKTKAYERLSYWARRQNLTIEDEAAKVSLDDYFEENQVLNWENFQVWLERTVKETLDLSDMDRLLPVKINLGGRRELEVHYPLGMDPYLEAPIQDFYGQKETPTILGGKIPLTLKLLGPHKRPIQVTKDLQNFWQKTYQEMKKEYQRDYPRHYWPEKPWEAKPYLLKSHLPKA